MTPTVEIAFYEPWRVGDRLVWSLEPADIASVTITQTLPGGYNTLDVQLIEYRVPKAWLRLNRFGHVICLVDGQVAFTGRLFTWSEAGRWCTGFPVKGYYFAGLDEHEFFSTDTTPSTTGAFLRTVLTQTEALVTPATGRLWVDPQTTQVPSEHSAAMPSAIIAEVLAQGDAGARITDMVVWDDMLARLLPRIPPDLPQYAISEDDDALSRTPDYEQVRGGLTVDYSVTSLDISGNQVTTPSTTPPASDATFIRRNRGVYRTARMDAGTLSDDAAIAYRNAQLAQLSQPAMPTAFSFSEGESLRTPTGAMLPQRRVRVGEWLWVENDPAPLPIITTRWDVLGQTLSGDCGQAAPGFETTLRRLRESDAALRAGVLVGVGTRTR